MFLISRSFMNIKCKRELKKGSLLNQFQYATINSSDIDHIYVNLINSVGCYRNKVSEHEFELPQSKERLLLGLTIPYVEHV